MKPKVAGNEDECWQCGTDVICREIPATAKYPAKPQWQNQDGTAHYHYDFKTKNTTCNIPEGQPESPEEAEQTLNEYEKEQDLSKGEQSTEVISSSTIKAQLDFQKEILTTILKIVTDIKSPENHLKEIAEQIKENYCDCERPIPNAVTNGKTCQQCLKLFPMEEKNSS